MDEVRVRELVGDLADNMSSVSPNAQDFLVDQSWAKELIEVVFEEDSSRWRT